MRRKLLAILTIFLFHDDLRSQEYAPAEIKKRRILSLEKTTSAENGEHYKMTIFYDIEGFDSLHKYESTTYIFEKQSSLNEVRLFRKLSVDEADEVHIYKYNADGSFNIEFIMHGAGTVAISFFDKQLRNYKVVDSYGDETLLDYTDNGLLSSMTYTDDSGIVRKIPAVITSTEQHNVSEITNPSYGTSLRYVYDKTGLVKEMKQSNFEGKFNTIFNYTFRK